MKISLLVSLLCLAAMPALAQTLPQGSGNPLQDICTGFLDQSGQGVSGDRNVLCTCLVRETKARLTVDEMKLYSRAGETGQSPPPAIMEKVIGIATLCLTSSR
jgi:hypothetical protein